jgi:hypothetical protein
MEKTNIGCKDVVSDLKAILTGYLAPLNLKYGFSQEQIYIDDVFSHKGAMPLILYNKQAFINNYFTGINVAFAERMEPFYAQIVIQRAEQSFFGTQVDIAHNMYLTLDNVEIDNGDDNIKIYNDFVMALAYEILSDGSFSFNPDTKKVMLDDCWMNYDKFMKELVLKQLQNVG